MADARDDDDREPNAAAVPGAGPAGADPGSHATEPDPGAPVRLTPGQRRAIGALLHQVARVIERFELVTGLRLDERLNYVELVDNLSPGERATACALATELVREANALAALCHIPPETASIRATLAGEFSVLWADAEDTGPSRLEGYGPVASETARRIAPHTRRMARLSLALAHLDTATSREAAPPGPPHES